MSGRMLRGDRILSPQELKKLLTETKQAKEFAVAAGKHLEWARDYFIFSLTAMTGLRISEIAKLRWRDILDDALIVKLSKGKKSRTVFFGPQTKKILSELRATVDGDHDRKLTPDDFLFGGQRGPITRHGVHYRFRYWAKKIGLRDGVTFHGLRHAYATTSLEKGVPLPTLKEQLGHSNISITSVYLHFTQQGKEAIQKIF
jgi:integrase/recombinase XerD